MPSLAGGGQTFGGGAGPGMQTVLAGRLLVDTYLAARETTKEVDYSLATLSRSLLSQDRSELQASSIPGALHTTLRCFVLSFKRCSSCARL